MDKPNLQWKVFPTLTLQKLEIIAKKLYKEVNFSRLQISFYP